MRRHSIHDRENDIESTRGGYPGRADALDANAQGDRRRQADIDGDPVPQPPIEAVRFRVFIQPPRKIQPIKTDAGGSAEIHIEVEGHDADLHHLGVIEAQYELAAPSAADAPHRCAVVVRLPPPGKHQKIAKIQVKTRLARGGQDALVVVAGGTQLLLLLGKAALVLELLHGLVVALRLLALPKRGIIGIL